MNNNNNIGRNIDGRIDDTSTINNNNIGRHINIKKNETISSLQKNINKILMIIVIQTKHVNLSLSSSSCYFGMLVKCIFTDCQVMLMNSENNDTANVDTNNNEVGSNSNSLGDDNSKNGNQIGNKENLIGNNNNNNSNATTGSARCKKESTFCDCNCNCNNNNNNNSIDAEGEICFMSICYHSGSMCEVGIKNKYEDDDDALVDLNLMCVMLDQGSKFEDSWCEVYSEESSVGNMHEVCMLDFGSVLVEQEKNVRSTSTKTYIGIDNSNGIKFVYNNDKEYEVKMRKSEFKKDINNNIKMNNLIWSILNRNVERYKEVTRSRIYDR